MEKQEIKEKLLERLDRYEKAPDVKCNTPETVLEYLIRDLRELAEEI